ncbi:hypothetical protein ThidrDRAFT_4623 [Thiorhodococcus drewsii AZ1]|uniref:Uncharacterized protein n=1 Tax=Thiorhodococcus drewsii AZ1 TaxID=765913 RepID=G2E8K9_9GAMM|nr:hypothetical protein [Thiorhodococcus drewsii]EGV27562.1 hypothetical protein ThidrDRAFT_4623 [Thiorhodococcus drewsii AZ1]
MSWKNWGDHPLIAFPVMMSAVIAASYAVYDHHYANAIVAASEAKQNASTPNPEVKTATNTQPVVPIHKLSLPKNNSHPNARSAEKNISKPILERNYVVVYKGPDGVNVRSQPSGRLLATAFEQNVSPITRISSTQQIKKGIPWIKVEMTGWMARRMLTKTRPYLKDIGNSISKVIWDGGGDPNDRFISLKSSPDVLCIVQKNCKNIHRHRSRNRPNHYKWRL